MTISATNVFEIKSVHDSSNEIPFVKLIFEPLAKQITLSGTLLNAQYSVDQYFILFVSDGYIYDEALHIYILDNVANLLESIEIFSLFVSDFAFLGDLRISSPNKLCFSFFSNSENWTLTVLEKPKIQLWANNDLVKRNQPFLHKAYCTLECTE
jgi:hypothetical protein